MTNGPKCFKCGEPGHRIVDCRKGEKYGKGLLIDSGNAFDEQGDEEEQEATFDEYGDVEEEFITGDNGLSKNLLVDEYTEEFYKYLKWVELAETDDQLVSRYIGGLQQNIQDSLNLFDPINVSATHQRALLLEKTIARGSIGFFRRGTGGSKTRYNGPFTPRNTTQSTTPNWAPITTGPPNLSATMNGLKCFKCVVPKIVLANCTSRS
jgi:hypothetical protein